MCITEEKLVGKPTVIQLHEHFLLIYKNYSVFPQLVDYWNDNRILFQRLSTTDKKNGDDTAAGGDQTSHAQ